MRTRGVAGRGIRSRGNLAAGLIVVSAVIPFLYVLGAGAAAPPPGGSAGGSATVVIHRVDDSSPDGVTRVRFGHSAGGETASQVRAVATGGAGRVVSAGPIGGDRGVVVVVDNSQEAGNAATQDIKEILGVFAPRAGSDGGGVGVVTVGGGARSLVSLTRDPAKFASDTSRLVLAPDPGSAMWDGLLLADQMLQSVPGPRSVVLLRRTPDTRSSTPPADVQRELRRRSDVLSVIDLAPDLPDSPALASLSRDLGGTPVAATTGTLGDTVAEVARRVDNLYEARLELPEAQERTNLTLTWPDASVEVSYQPHDIVTLGEQMAPLRGGRGGPVSLVHRGWFPWVILGLVLAAAAGLAGAVLTMLVRDPDAIDQRLAIYDAATTDGSLEPDDGSVRSRLVRRALEATTDLAHRQGFLVAVERAVERADVRMHAGEVVALTAVLPIAGSLLAYLATESAVGAVIGLLAGAAVVPVTLKVLAERRSRAFEEQLPDALQLLAGTLRAGYSISQAISAVAEEISEPMGRELRRAVAEAQLGRPIEDCLDAVAERVSSRDFAWAVMAIRIQREVGGNLAELLSTVGDTMVQRERLRREVRGLTAEGRMSAYVLGALPLGLLAFMAYSNPSYLKPLYSTTLGQVITVVSVLNMLAGFAWMKKIVTIEV